MKIAQVSPLYESVPPKYYGGTERVVSYLTDELVRLGHRVTLFASGDSVTTAHLKPMCGKATRLDEKCKEPVAWHMLMVEQIVKEAHDYDIIHSHIEYLFLPIFRALTVPVVATIHSRTDTQEMSKLYQEFKEMPLVSISNAQRQPIFWANWQGTTYHGIPESLYSPSYDKGDFLLFLGRFCPEKRPNTAVEIAERARVPLKMAAKVDRADKEYYESEVRGVIEASSYAEYVGEVGEAEKQELLRGAKALLLPIDWPEPFGLVMIEALACGTPVIAFRCGSVPEIVEDGITGIIVDSVAGAVDAVRKVDAIDRRVCREMFEMRFTSERMAKGYLEIYERLCFSSSGVRVVGKQPRSSVVL